MVCSRVNSVASFALTPEVFFSDYDGEVERASGRVFVDYEVGCLNLVPSCGTGSLKYVYASGWLYTVPYGIC